MIKKIEERDNYFTHVIHYIPVYSYCFRERTDPPLRKKALEHDECDTRIKRSSHTPPPVSNGPHRITVNTWTDSKTV